MLWKKIIRDLNQNKGAYLACITIITIGLMVFTSFSMVIDNLTLSKENFYKEQNFAGGFAEVRSMPRSEVEDLKKIKGIDDIQGRLVKDVRVYSPQRSEDIYLRMVSVIPGQKNPVNGVMLEKGRALDNDKMSIWLDNQFFEANNLELNQEIEVIIEGKKKPLRVVGMGKSPEFIYAMRTESDLFPSPETFGIAFVPYEVMDKLFSAETVNNLVFTLKPGTDYEDVEKDLEPELKSFGLKEIYSREDQTSNMLLTQELKGLESTANSLPVLFLAVAAMILFIMLKRMVEQQRGQIGVLKAFGYTNKEILFHYISYALVLGAAGGIAGGLLGITLSFPFTSMYRQYFNMPGLTSKFSPVYLIISILIALAFSLIAGYQGCKGVLTLAPAEAMNPPAPPTAKKTPLEKITFYWRMLTVQGIMATRNMFRNKGRSIFILLGIMFTFSIIGLTWSFKDLSEEMLFKRYEKIETYDVKVSLAGPRDEKGAVREMQNFNGENLAEPLAEVPVTLKNKWHEKDIVIIGIPDNSKLYTIRDKNDKEANLPEEGILIPERLSELLNAEKGMTLEIESAMMKDSGDSKKVEIAGVIPQYLGLNAYMNIDALQEILEQGDMATSLMLDINKGAIPRLQNEYNRASGVTGIEDSQERLRSSMEMMESFSGMIFILAFIGIITGFAIIYNSSVVALSERGHELASMMVLGMTPREVLSVITFEQWFIGIFGMLAGIPLTKILLVGMAQSINNDLYTMPNDITVFSMIIAFVVTSFSIWIAQYAASKKINKLQLVEALKTRE